MDGGGDGLESEALIPYQTKLTENFMGIVHSGKGVVTGADLIEGTKSATQLVQNTENFYYEVVDFTDVTELRITDEDLQEIVGLDHFAALFRPEAVVVIIAPRDDLFAIGQQWERHVQDLGWKTRIARSRDEAMKWLRENYPTPPQKPAHKESPGEWA